MSVYRNILTQQLIDITASSNKLGDIEVPIELLKYIDSGFECNPVRYQYEVFEKADQSCVEIACKLESLKVFKYFANFS